MQITPANRLIALFGSLALAVTLAACGPSGSEVDTPADTGEGTEQAGAESSEAPAEPEAEVGTRQNPVPIGSTITADDWTAVINSVKLGADAEILAAQPYNEPAAEGHEYILINYTVTYTGSDPDGGTPAFVGIEYVTADGKTVDGLAKLITAPDPIDSLSTLYEGASATGNTAIEVPSPADGVIAVRAGIVADKVFVAIT